MLAKYASSLAVASVLALLIFIGMQALIAPDGNFLGDGSDQPQLNFVRVDAAEDNVETRDRRQPEEPPEPDDPPETPDASVQDTQQQTTQMASMDMPSMDLPVSDGGGPSLGGLIGGGGGMSGFDSDVIATVKVPPTYPQKASRAKLEGYVVMAVSIRADGTVSDVEVLESDPPRLFDQAAVNAMQRWRFRPKTVDGEPQPQKARQRMEFNLNQQ